MTADPSMIEPVAWVVLLRYGPDRWSGEMLTDVLPKNDGSYKIVGALYSETSILALQKELVTVKGERDAATTACKSAWDSIRRFPGSLHDRAMSKLERVIEGRNIDYPDHEARADRSEALIRELVEALRKLLAAAEAAADIASDHADWEQVAYQYGDAVLCARTLVEKQP